MTLLALEHVGKRYRDGRRERIVLEDVNLQVGAGELVVVYGERRSGRSTLLRIAAGLEQPDSGRVLFDGIQLGRRASVLGSGIGYVSKNLRASEEQGVTEQVMAPLLARGHPLDRARELARSALARAGAGACAASATAELSAGEQVRVALARTLSLSPALVVVDEPAGTVELSERDGVLAALRTLARNGTAVLASSGEPSELAGADRGLTLSDGRLRGGSEPRLAAVLPLRRSG
jgi:putative ABC transport system ATP-binding protein